MQVTDIAQARDYDAGEIRSGKLDSKLLLQGREGAPNNYRVALTTAETDWAAPRHRHNFDQIRFPVSGDWHFGEGRTLHEGWVGYFPEGVHYGPQLRTPGLKMLVVQFGGASGSGFIGRDRRRAGFDELSAKGSFENGAFTYVDGKGQRHNKDGYEAVWEHLMGRRLEYPKPRFDNQILMNPATHDWIADETHPGIAHKVMGKFTERAIGVGFLRIEAGAVFDGGLHDAPEFLFQVSGKVSADGGMYTRFAAFGFEPNEGARAIEALETSEFLRVQFAKF